MGVFQGWRKPNSRVLLVSRGQDSVMDKVAAALRILRVHADRVRQPEDFDEATRGKSYDVVVVPAAWKKSNVWARIVRELVVRNKAVEVPFRPSGKATTRLRPKKSNDMPSGIEQFLDDPESADIQRLLEDIFRHLKV